MYTEIFKTFCGIILVSVGLKHILCRKINNNLKNITFWRGKKGFYFGNLN